MSLPPSNGAPNSSRRSFTRSMIATAIVAPAILRSARAQSSSGSITFGSNGGSTQRVFEKMLIPKFTEETGIKVTYVPGQPPEHVAKLRAHGLNAGLDVVWFGGPATYNAIDEGLLMPFDPEKIPNISKTDIRIIDPTSEREPTVVSLSATGNGLLYRKDVYAKNNWAPPANWLDLWDPRFKGGRVGMYGMSVSGGVEMLLQVARDLTGDYKNLQPAFEKFRELRASSNLYDFFSTAGAWETAMQQGGLWLAVNSYSRAMQLLRMGLPIGMVQPKSGMPGHYQGAAITKGVKDLQASYTWLNWLLSPVAQGMMATQLGYLPLTAGIEIPDDLKPFFPDPALAWYPDWRWVGERYGSIVAQWQRIVER